MCKKLTPEKVIDITWLSVALTFCWPLPLKSTRVQLVGYKIVQMVSTISGLMLFLPLLYATYLHYDDIPIVSGCVCLSLGIIQITIQTIVCSIQHDKLQRVVDEMMTCIREARHYEREVFSKYIARCDTFYASSVAWMYITATAFSFGPVVLPNSFPTDAEYPFRVNYTPVNIIIYMHQCFLSYQCAAHVCLSVFGALLLWFSAARFECLAMELRESTDIRSLIACIKKQLHLRRYAEDVLNGFRFIIVYALISSTITLSLCGFIMIMNSPLMMKVQFMTICLTVLTEIYMYAWPADYITDMSTNVSRSIYDMIWYEQSVEIQKLVLSVLEFQNPVTLSISGVLPEFSLHYYCSYVSNAFSIFAALRVVVQDE